jgi:ribosomal protein L30E
MSVNEEIKKAMKENAIVLGSRMVQKMLKNSELKSVIFANNAPEVTRKDLEYYSNNFGADVKGFEGNSRQLGEFCGKPFNILVLGVKK